jgi:putative DNA primase/helicase
MKAPVAADWSLTADDRPLFEALIKRIMPDENKRAFLQRFLGYSLCGMSNEPAFCAWLGDGANGKGTITKIMCGTLGTEGGYATMASFNTFLETKNNKADETRNDLVSLIGKRFIAASEVNKNSPPLNAALLKCFAGGDGDFQCRGNWESMRNFTPKGKLVLSSNDEPKINDNSFGMRRRLKKIWWEVEIPEAEQDKQLAEKILAAERAAVLNWLLEGWCSYQQIGLATPAVITAETEEYLDSQSMTCRFMADRYVCNSTAQPIKNTIVYKTYTDWCTQGGEKYPLTLNKFSHELTRWGKRHSVISRHTRDGSYWFGLQPIDDATDGTMQFDDTPTQY